MKKTNFVIITGKKILSELSDKIRFSSRFLKQFQFYNIDMEESQTITEEELTSTKQDRPKSDEIIAKVEELGQQMAPVPAQEPTEGTL